MSIKLMSLVWDISLPPGEKLVLLALADQANDAGTQCWPAVETIARRSGQSVRTVRRALASLEERGHLTRQHREGTSSQYHVHPCHHVTPAIMSPLPPCHPTPAIVSPTPAIVSPKPSITVKEPPNVKASDDALTPTDIFDGWNEFAAKHGLPKAEVFTDRRKRQAKARLRQFPELAKWQKALDHIRKTPFLLGDNDRGWRADFDFLLQERSLTKLVEGSYGKAD